MSKIFFPQYAKGRKDGIEIKLGESILDHIKRIGGVEISSECGGRGVCGLDVVRIEQGYKSLSPLSTSEQKFFDQGKLKRGQRLACQARIIDDARDIKVFISNVGSYTILTDIIERNIDLNPFVLKKGNRVFYYPENDLGKYNGRILGLAVDIGTTTIVMQIIDLENGKNLGNPIAFKNPQIIYGNDVISRIGYSVSNEHGLKELQENVINGVNESLKELEIKLGYEKGSIKNSIYDAVIVGNSTMRNIFFGRDVRGLGFIPFEPDDKKPILVKSKQIGLDINESAFVYGPSLIGGHAGADCLADIIATEIYKSPQINMIIDIGTNGEVVIGNNEKILTASCAAGGAYEGYQISCGIGAIAGAITEFKMDNSKISYKTIGDRKPLGICGSGVIDLLAEMLRNGIMNSKARVSENFYINDGLFITQDDINQLIIAKAGLRTDQDLLIKYYGTSINNIGSIYLAGAFGNYINIENSMTIGLLPKIDKNKFVRFGNGALAGAIDILLSRDVRNDSENLFKLITHTKPNEIEGEKFQYMVADNMYFNQNNKLFY